MRTSRGPGGRSAFFGLAMLILGGLLFAAGVMVGRKMAIDESEKPKEPLFKIDQRDKEPKKPVDGGELVFPEVLDKKKPEPLPPPPPDPVPVPDPDPGVRTLDSGSRIWDPDSGSDDLVSLGTRRGHLTLVQGPTAPWRSTPRCRRGRSRRRTDHIRGRSRGPRRPQ